MSAAAIFLCAFVFTFWAVLFSAIAFAVLYGIATFYDRVRSCGTGDFSPKDGDIFG